MTQKFMLDELPLIAGKKSNRVAWYFFDIHYKIEGRGINPLEPKKALDCQVAIYRKLEELYRQRRIGSVYVEGTEKGIVLLDDIKKQNEKYEKTVAHQYEGTRTRFDDAGISAFIADTGKAIYPFAINFYGFIPVIGWEGDTREKLDQLSKEISSATQFLDETYKQISRGEIKVGSEEEINYRRKKAAFDRMFDVEVRKKRSEHAYFNPLELTEQMCATHPSRNRNYAVVVGRNHMQDIVDIIATQEQHPEVRMFVCP